MIRVPSLDFTPRDVLHFTNLQYVPRVLPDFRMPRSENILDLLMRASDTAHFRLRISTPNDANKR